MREDEHISCIDGTQAGGEGHHYSNITQRRRPYCVASALIAAAPINATFPHFVSYLLFPTLPMFTRRTYSIGMTHSQRSWRTSRRCWSGPGTKRTPWSGRRSWNGRRRNCARPTAPSGASRWNAAWCPTRTSGAGTRTSSPGMRRTGRHCRRT